MPYVLKRIDQGGGYVARPGGEHSYTKKLEEALVFPTREAAQGNSCVENEVVIDLDSIFGR
jgi:hypothetical protein